MVLGGVGCPVFGLCFGLELFWLAAVVRLKSKLFYLTLLVTFIVVRMATECVTVSAKIPKQLKERMQRLKIKPSKILKKALEDEVKKRELEELKEEINRLKPILDKVNTEDIVKSIREDRDNR